MKNPLKLISIVFALMFLLVIIGCSGSPKTEVNYIGPEGYVVQEITRPVQEKPSQTTTPPAETPSSPPANTTSNAANSSGNISQDENDNKDTSNQFSSDTLQTEKANIKDVLPKLCDDSQILVVGYVACTYDSKTGYADLTLKNNNKEDIEQVWFYISNNLEKVSYERSGGIGSGDTADYALPVQRWAKDYGKLDRIVVTPVIKTPYGLYACNNKQMLVYWTESVSGCPIG
jgi:hypothetical protein